MKTFSLTILLLIVLGACKLRNPVVNVTAKVLPIVFYDEALQVLTGDTIKYTVGANPFLNVFDARTGFCKVSNDSLLFFFRNVDLTSYYLSFFVHKDSSQVSLSVSSCNGGYTYTPLDYKLTLNKKSYSPGDTLLADLFLTAVTNPGSWLFSNNDTFVLQGKIKLKVKGPGFSFDQLQEETNLAKFYKLLAQRPNTIREVDLNKCGLKELPAVLRQFKNLRKLSLDENDLSNADFTMLAELKELRSLSFQDCRLKQVPGSLWQLRKLEVLNLFNNALTTISDSLYSLTALKDLCIGRNQLTTLSPQIARLKDLETLETSWTAISVYPDAMSNLKKLKEIYPSDTMKYIPASLRKYTSACNYY